VTTKSSIRNWGVLYKSGVYASKVTCLTLGDLYNVFEIKTEGGVIHSDRCAEVSPAVGGIGIRAVDIKPALKRGRSLLSDQIGCCVESTEPPWYVNRMPGDVGGGESRGSSLY